MQLDEIALIDHNKNPRFIAGVISYQNVTRVDSYIEIPLDIETFGTLFTSKEKLSKYLQINRHFVFILLNYLEYQDAYRRLTGYLQPDLKPFESMTYMMMTMDEPLMEFIYVHLSQKIFNYLSSFKTFIDFNNAVVKSKEFKENHGLEIIKKYDEMLSEIKLNNIEYSLLYELRNYCQHQWFPPSTIQAIRKIAETNDFSIRASLSYIFKKNEFIKSNKRLSKEFLRILNNSNLDQEFDLLPLINKNFLIIKKIHLLTMGEEIKELSSTFSIIKNVVEYLRPYGAFPVEIKCIKFNNSENAEIVTSVQIPSYMSSVIDQIYL